MDTNHNKIIDKVYSNNGNQAILELIEGEHMKILDVGCGAGDNARILARIGHMVDGITLSESEALECRYIMKEVYVHNLEFGLPAQLKGQYDYIICSHVLEHIVYPENVLRDMRSQLKEGGKVVIALPNLMHYKSRIQLMLGNFNYEDSGIWDNTHVKWYTFKTGMKLLVDNGYIVTKGFVDGDIPLLTLFRFLPSNFRKVIYKMLTSISKGLFGGQLIYLASSNHAYTSDN